MPENPFPGSGAYPRLVVNDVAGWMELVQAYSTSKPKRLLAEGDSWLAYPQILGSKNITLQLADNYDDMILLCLATSGDEAVAMLSSLSNKAPLMSALRDYDFDFLLFSGGGNDIVGAWDFDFLLKEKASGMNWQDCIHAERFDRRLDQIRNAYLDLLEYTFLYSRNKKIKVVTHTYDYPIPDPKGVVGGKSWMYPYLMAKKITDKSDQKNIAKYFMNRFAEMLAEVAKSPVAQSRFQVVNTFGLVKADEWANEIHPTAKGFKKIAKKIYVESLK